MAPLCGTVYAAPKNFAIALNLAMADVAGDQLD